MPGDRTLTDDRARRPAPRIVHVEVVAGPDAGRVCELPDDDALSVGTAANNTLVSSDPKVSRYHLELRATDQGVRVTDLSSLNGTWIDSIRVVSVVVPAGTHLALGDSVLRARDTAAPPSDADEPRPQIPGLVGDSKAMRRIATEVHRLAPSHVSVLVQGETGTGKEGIARALHVLSERRAGPFVVVDCGSLPATLVASELFGHERGAFTGADRRRVGAFERAHGGTVFLDEIGELPLAVQPSLLGVLERRRFRSVGGDRDIVTDVRVVAATHRELRAAVNDGTFRADLYYRLAVARLLVPSLRERREDIVALVEHFAREVRGSSSDLPFSAETLTALAAHPWAGNVRELRNVVESALAMGRVQLDDGSSIAPAHTTPVASLVDPDAMRPYGEARAAAVDDFEKAYLTALVARFAGNASQASRFAGMDRNYLVSLLRKHGLR